MPGENELLTTTGNGAFNPDSLAWKFAWEADDLSASDNDPIATIVDRSGNTENLIQTVESKKPVYKSSVAAMNNQPALLFDKAAVQHLRGLNKALWNFLHTGDCIVMMVYNMTEAVASTMSLISNNGSLSTAYGQTIFLRELDELNLRISKNFAPAFLMIGTTNTGSITPQTTHVVTSKYVYDSAGDDWTLFVDGSVDYTDETGSPPPASGDATFDLHLGIRSDGGAPFEGYLSAVYTGQAVDISDSSIAKMHTFLKSKYGVS